MRSASTTRTAAATGSPIDPEIVHIKSGGFIKSTVTHGIIKEDRNGHINGRESKLALQCPIEFLIYVPEGVVASEYDLLPLPPATPTTASSDVLTGGVFHSTGGADRDEVPFNPVKTAPHTYQFTVDDKTLAAASSAFCRPAPAMSPTAARSIPSPSSSRPLEAANEDGLCLIEAEICDFARQDTA